MGGQLALFLAGLLVGLLGAIPIANMLSDATDDASDSTVPPSAVAETAAAAEESLQQDETLHVDGLSDTVTKVLQIKGLAQAAGVEDLGSLLPDAVTRLLVERQAVLTVPREPGSDTP